MVKPNKLQAKIYPKIKGKNSGGVVVFGPDSKTRQQHTQEKHGVVINSCIPGYDDITKRMRRLRSNLDDTPPFEASTSCAPSSEFRNATAQSMVPSCDQFCTADTDIDPDFTPAPPLRYNDSAAMPQAHHSQKDVSESYAAVHDKESLQLEYRRASRSSLGSKARAQAAPGRIFRPCRLRRRTSRTTARTSPSSTPLTPQSSAIESILSFYENEQDDSAISPQGVSSPLDVDFGG